MVIKHDIWISCFQMLRTLHIYLPDTYEHCDKRYPVLYMFDGHNLFFDEDATFGKCWGLKDFLDICEEDLIIVGLECNHEGIQRLEEFSPYSFYDEHAGWIDGRGDLLLEWMTQTLKPWIDTHLRTLPQREFTGIAGSSMGGLMALYGILHHFDTYSKAGCLSPYINEEILEALKQEMKRKLPDDTRIYLSWGSDEYRGKLQLAKATARNMEIIRELCNQHIHFYPNFIVKGRHDEASWEKELPIALPYLFPDE